MKFRWSKTWTASLGRNSVAVWWYWWEPSLPWNSDWLQGNLQSFLFKRKPIKTFNLTFSTSLVQQNVFTNISQTLLVSENMMWVKLLIVVMMENVMMKFKKLPSIQLLSTQNLMLMVGRDRNASKHFKNKQILIIYFLQTLCLEKFWSIFWILEFQRKTISLLLNFLEI